MLFHASEPNIATISASIKERVADRVRIQITLTIKEGWFVRAVAEDDHISTFQIDVRGDGVSEILRMEYPPAFHIDLLGDPEIIYWQGSVEFVADVQLEGGALSPGIRVLVTCQPCTIGRCQAIQHLVAKVEP